MSKRLAMLVQLIRDRHEAAATNPYILFLGAGASMSSGASLFDPIIKSVGCATYEEFSRHMEGFSCEERYTILRRHLEDLHPSPAALQLAKLVRDGYFSIILTTNFDNLLEVALNAVGVGPDKYVVHVHTAARPLKDLATRLRRKSPRIKIVKLHGDLKEHDFALTDTETLQYAREVEDQLRQLFASDDVIILGSRFGDANLQRVVDSKGSSIWYVNPSPATGAFEATLRSRGSHQNQITGDEGTFDAFLGALYENLLGQDEPPPIRLQWTVFHPFVVGCAPPLHAGNALEHGRRRIFDDGTVVDWFDFGVACAWRQTDVLYPSITDFAQQRRDLYKQILDGPGVPSITAAVAETRAGAAWNLPDALRGPLPAEAYVLSVVRLSEPTDHPRLDAILQLLSCPSLLVDAYRGPEEAVVADADDERKYLQTGVEADFEEFKYADRLRGCAAWSGVAFVTATDALATAIIDFEAELQALWWFFELFRHARAVDPGIVTFVEEHVHPILTRTLATGSREATPLTLAREAIIHTSRIENQWRMAHD